MLQVVKASSNRKLGPGVSCTYRPVDITCPRTCPLLNHGCYAQRAHTHLVAKKSGQYRHSLSRADGTGLMRHMVSGDFLKPTKNGRRVVDRQLMREIYAWHRGRTQRSTIGWGYTHSARRLAKAGFGPHTFPKNLHILASCHSVSEAKSLQAEGWRTARVTTEYDRQDNEVYCPVDKAKHEGAKCEATCASCRLCFEGEQNIVFFKF
jgi:hypothetical protein